ncbi:hypothetical protein [Streptomyces sp. NBC_01483]|uniref:hypothetical protein n=1 Tax=Streptomyces sp. NBC_01483 TaxID=2903883 RepID=UPI002E344932|nr:hypothetical protein [Streptomyces sp. NBC_01483]
MTTPILARGQGRTLLAAESVLSTASAVWWLCLLWIHRNVLYAVPVAAALIAAVLLSLLLTWDLLLRSASGGREPGARRGARGGGTHPVAVAAPRPLGRRPLPEGYPVPRPGSRA